MRRRLAAESKVAAAEMPVMMSLDYELYTVMAVVDDVKDSKGGVVQEFHLKIFSSMKLLWQTIQGVTNNYCDSVIVTILVGHRTGQVSEPAFATPTTGFTTVPGKKSVTTGFLVSVLFRFLVKSVEHCN